MNRFTVRLLIISVLVLAFLLMEYINFRKRRNTRRDASQLGREEYLKYLKTEYQELKFRAKTASKQAEHDKWYREMQKVEKQIILIERDMEEDSAINNLKLK